MINLEQHGVDVLQDSVMTNDLVAIANLEMSNNIDSVVLNILEDNKILIEGKYENIVDKYAVSGREIVKIKESSIDGDNTIVVLDRRMFSTKEGFSVDSKFRSVVVLDDTSDLTLTSWEFEDTIGNVTSNLFPVELGSGNISLISDLKLWSPHSMFQKYKVRNRKTVAYIFKGIDNVRFLKFTTIVNKARFNTKGKREPNKIIMDVKTILSRWYDKDIRINTQLKSVEPKEFFKTLFSLKDNEVYYAEGVSGADFPKINNLHTKEYNTISELLKAYCNNGIRFCFDREEKLKIFGDFKVDSLDSKRVLDYDITDSMMTEDDQLIYNTINTQAVQRQTLYNFEDLDRKYVKFFKVLRGAIQSDKIISIAENGDYTINAVEIANEELHSHVQLKDYVLLKRTEEPFIEMYGRVIGKGSEHKVNLSVILQGDKDYKLFNLGKGKYLYNLLNQRPVPMDLYYVREDLPMSKFTRNKGGEEVDRDLMMPLLPRVDGETKYVEEFSMSFGSAQNLKVGSYTGITEEIDKIYGTWDSSKLLYNRELDQFSNTIYPPIFALSNKVKERVVNENTSVIEYTTFDNSDLLLEVEKPKDTNSDFTLKIQNTSNVNKDIDLYVGKELSRLGNKILQVEDIEPYKIGDVLIVNKPDNLTPQEESEFDEVLSHIKWTITHKTSQTNPDTKETKHYIYVDSPFAKRQKSGEVYEFTRFPNKSIVFLQELYFRGNPVIEFAQDVTGFSKGVTIEGETSRDLYGEKKYELDAKQLNKDSLRILMGYILDNFQATKVNTTKFNVPLSVFNALDLELLDVVRVNDPTYTNIKSDMLWVVLSVSCRNSTNEVKLKLLNINHENVKPYKIDIKDVIEYKPVEIPTYDHAGGEGNVEDNNDGTGGTDIDKALGQFWLAEVDPKKFRAKVEKFEGNFIYFKDFSGTEYEEYQNKLFPVDEFAVNIKGEVIFVQSDMNYRAFIKKRRVYDTEETIIAPEDEINFLITTTYVDVDGTFFGRKMMMGDGDNYLSVDPIKGVKIVGDFVVGENNKNPGNDLWQSLQNNRSFRQPNRPVNTPSYMLKEGDIWIDTDDENHSYMYDGSVWISTRDGSIVSTKNTVFIEPEEPQEKDGRPLLDGDTWYDSDDGMKPYVYKNGKWVNVTDMTLQDAIDKVQETANKNLSMLDDIANDNKLTASEKKQVELEINSIKIEYPKYTIEGEKFGITTVAYSDSYKSLMGYIDPLIANIESTSDINRGIFKSYFSEYYRYRQELINAISSKAKELADKAQADATTALGNSKIFWGTEKPTDGMKENDMWYDTDDQHHPYIYRDGEWISARDRIFETEGGNKVHFSDVKPPSSGYGVKAGDMWFDTANNNNLYVLLEQPDGSLEWALGSDANDKIENGRIVLNGNTVINGDFKVKGNNIELTGDTKVNGLLEIFGAGKGIVSYDGDTIESSRYRVIIRGGEILFQEKI